MSNVETVEVRLRQRIADERRREGSVTADGVYQRIAAGDILRATGTLLFHTPPSDFVDRLKWVLDTVAELFPEADAGLQKNMLDFLVKLGIDLRSFLPNWVLMKGLDQAAISSAAERVTLALAELIEYGADVPAGIAAALRSETVSRLKAEDVDDEEAESLADQLLGSSLVDYVSNIAAELNSSNLIEVARARFRGETMTELGNDYAAFLQYVIWLGGSFVTTNPVLIPGALEMAPEFWDERVNDLILSRYTPADLKALLGGPSQDREKAITTLSSLCTMIVVEQNCRLLRDIFLVTEGSEGYVCLQVNPKNHNDGEAMVAEARMLYAELGERLGGVPNVVFKLTATSAGLYAAEKLTADGIGVTITNNFAAFMELGFGEVLDRGHALTSYLVLMNGRMSFPVRDELKEMGVDRGVVAARWAGVAVARKAYHKLYDPPEKGGMGIDPGRVKLLVASLRIYDDWIPDISELWGCQVITIFPNVRHAFDSHRRDFDGMSILGVTPAEDMKIMFKSEIFRQAWWVPGDPEEYKPNRVLTLKPEDAEAVIAWPPMAKTLEQFIDTREQLDVMVQERMRQLAK